MITAKKYDIKQLKDEIWKILENVIPQIDHRT